MSQASQLSFISSATGQIVISATTVSNSTTTGALVVSGGVGIGGGINVGGASTFTNYVRYQILNTPAQDLVNISNVGYPATTAGLNNLSITYVGGAAAVEASAGRIDITPGTTTAGTWNAWRAVAATGAFSGVTYNGLKLDSMPSASTGTANAIFVGTSYTNVLNYNNTTVIDGTGNIIQRSTGTYFAGSTLQGLTAGINSQAQAVVANAQIIEFSTVAANSATVLPYVNTGTRIFIANDGANPLNIYPPVGGLIDQAATNAAITISAGGMWEGVALTTSTWTSISPDTQGTTNQITVTQGNGIVQVGLATSAVLPGTPTVQTTASGAATGAEIPTTNWVRSYGGFQGQYVYTSGNANNVTLGSITNTPVNKVKVTVVGGGGAGGGSSTTKGSSGSGGGSGGTAIYYFTGITSATTFSYSVGTGGTGASAANGGNGGTSTFTMTSITISALGGTGGLNGATAAVPVAGSAGGTATIAGGVIANFHGITGGAGGTSIPISTSQVVGGHGGNGFLGGAPAGAAVTTAAGGTNAPANTGAGGSGAGDGSSGTAQTGGNGGSGVIIIEY
jgi:hypothetical protein